MSDVTHANGVPIRPRGYDSQQARRLAADLPRGGREGIEHIKCNLIGGPVVRIDKQPDETYGFHPPDGWHITHVNVTETGGWVYVHLERDG